MPNGKISILHLEVHELYWQSLLHCNHLRYISAWTIQKSISSNASDGWKNKHLAKLLPWICPTVWKLLDLQRRETMPSLGPDPVIYSQQVTYRITFRYNIPCSWNTIFIQLYHGAQTFALAKMRSKSSKNALHVIYLPLSTCSSRVAMSMGTWIIER